MSARFVGIDLAAQARGTGVAVLAEDLEGVRIERAVRGAEDEHLLEVLEGALKVGVDVPLGEAVERYLVRLMRGGAVLWQEVVDRPACSVPAEVWASARQEGPFAAEVAQLSDEFGAGPFARRMIHV